MCEIFWLILSYFVGSVPSGYLVSKYYGKNILEVGWRKTSGSNVFKNVGKGAGIITALLDLLKGFLVVYGAKSLGLNNTYQILSGVLAVTGNNWSVFLKFSGGRGLATFIGGFLALTPKFLFFSIAPFLVLALIWQASMATLLFLFTAFVLSIYFNHF